MREKPFIGESHHRNYIIFSKNRNSQDGLKKVPLIRFHMPFLTLSCIMCCYFNRLAPDSSENQDCPPFS